MPRAAVSSLPLSALRAFAATARLGSIKAAAAELGVTPGAVSHQVRTLEAYLGTPLFDRVHRAVQRTRAGEQLGEAANRAFEEIGRALEALAEAGLIAGSATLSVSAAPTFAAKWLAPRVHAFQSAYPEIALRLRAEEMLTDPGGNRQVDVAIRYGRGPYAPELIAERLWPDGVVVAVCAPGLAQRFADVEELVHARLFRTATPADPERREPIAWTAWFEAAGVSGPAMGQAVRAAAHVGTTQLALEAAASGHGVALSPLVLVAEDLAQGRLVEPFSTRLVDPHAFWMLYQRSREHEASIRKFATWLKLLAISDRR